MAVGSRVTLPGHVQFGEELLLGPGTPYRWRSLSGWEELPALDSGSVNRSDAHGAFVGRLLAQPRTVTLDDMTVRAPAATIGATVGTLNAATAVSDVEQPLVVWLDERGPLLAFARVVRRAVPVGRGYRLGTITGAAVQWEASDPRRYSLTEQQRSATLADPGMAAYNAGDAAAHPVITFRGPVERPSLTNTATGDILEYDVDLAAGELLRVDTREGTVALGEQNVLYTATNRCTPEQGFALAAGTTPLTFGAAAGSIDPAASATVLYRAAYW
ncbi:phage distal tail protein [Streptomyces sp. YPW6]|uniref:phage distal tail protein n=1 Tax=Streptomyces sp. YPW6 TaxID=2840373 RepID=UPI003D71F204